MPEQGREKARCSTRIRQSWGKESQKYMQKAQPPQWTHCAKWLWLVEVMRRGWKMVKKAESCVSHTWLVTAVLKLSVHHLTQDPLDFFKTTSCPPSTLLSQLTGIAFLGMCPCFPTSSSAGPSHRCSFSPVLVCLVVHSHRSSSNCEQHQKISIFSSTGSP